LLADTTGWSSFVTAIPAGETASNGIFARCRLRARDQLSGVAVISAIFLAQVQKAPASRRPACARKI
jgi:hypothetical protein